MKYPVYAIRDSKVGFQSPMVDVNDASAMRNFSHAVQNSESLMFSHAADFTLFRIGAFDTDTGRFEPLDLPAELVNAQAILMNKDV